MSWIEHHKVSEDLASQAQTASSDGRKEDALALYARAALAEDKALADLDTSKTRTLGISAVSAASLYYKAAEFENAEEVAVRWLNFESLPAFAKDQLRSLLQAIRSKRVRTPTETSFASDEILDAVRESEVISDYTRADPTLRTDWASLGGSKGGSRSGKLRTPSADLGPRGLSIKTVENSEMIRPTRANLTSRDATEPLTRWLISAAKERKTLTYGEAKRRLETECGFGTIFSTNMGYVAGTAMDEILEHDPTAPLLNVLLVRADTRLPGDGVNGYLRKRFLEGHTSDIGNNPEFRENIVRKAAQYVYAYTGWDDLYRRIFGNNPDSTTIETVEKDGIRYGRKGEGDNHKRLRLWVKNNPDKLKKEYRKVRAETEVELLSGDRVDVVYYAEKRTVAIEVKSRDSNWSDLRRGIYQCIKYRAVLGAQVLQQSIPVHSLLVTEEELDGDLKQLAKRMKIECQVVPPEQ